MSLYVRQGRSGLGDVMAASFNRTAMDALVASQRQAMMQALQQGSYSDPTVMDPGYGAYEPRSAGSSAGVPWGYIVGGGAVLAVLGVVVYRARRG